MESIPRPEKRKAEEEDYEESSKRPFIEDPSESKEYNDTNVVKGEEYEPISFTADPKEDNEEEKMEKEEEEEYEPKPIKEETPVPLETVVPFDRLIILHLEATCDENPTNPAAVQVTKENSEIIELSFVVLNASNMEVLHKQQIYVKPERTTLTPFCTEVTGIKWSSLAEAGTLKDAIAQLDDYIQKEIENENKSFCFVTHGGWVLRIQLPREARDKNITLPNYLSFCRMFDLKQEIQRWQVHHPEISLRSTSLRDLCEIFHLERVTDQTVGLNAALTTVDILKYLTAARHSDVFVHPIDTNADLKQFKKEESQVIHLAGLPFEVTQGELEAWFSSNGLRPKTMLMIQPSDNSKPSISGFVVFQLHIDAMRALALNGRCLGDRPIEVCPSSSRVIDAAGNMLVSFPLQAKSRQLRPGDWNCFNCGFHNFASRRHCFKCNAENPSPSPHASTGPPAPTFNVGDWMCPNPSCAFHNYASRMQCKKCGGYKPGGNKINNTVPHHHHNLSLHNSHVSQGPPPAGGPIGGYQGGRPHHHITFRPGDWYCPNPACGFQNFASRNSCFRCHTPNPNANQQPQHQQYSPHQPGYGYGAQQVQQQPQQQAQQAQHQEPSNSYSSNVGGYNNTGSGAGGSGGYGYGQPGGGYSSGQNNYAVPGGGYGGGSSTGGGGGYPYSSGGGGGGSYSYGGGVHQSGPPGGGPHSARFRPGDWICPSCNTHNFATRFQCLKCSTAKPYNPQGGAPPMKR
ncbi:hypothetical protein BDF21DRAFT_383649 [Thamnidium elegans]|uniref:Uncharacterized protein n=1 Tax=Thamnidium elegans TaxID=101142 RepID=A0A8H7SKL5_9FUNG|nr:hypothetical protein INT48_000418 [Thamnidium elegans]KAI8079420.1 hypothetical protein BDF21DRAFT_383649 [Thamnidium elegans]